MNIPKGDGSLIAEPLLWDDPLSIHHLRAHLDRKVDVMIGTYCTSCAQDISPFCEAVSSLAAPHTVVFFCGVPHRESVELLDRVLSALRVHFDCHLLQEVHGDGVACCPTCAADIAKAEAIIAGKSLSAVLCQQHRRTPTELANGLWLLLGREARLPEWACSVLKLERAPCQSIDVEADQRNLC